MACRAKSRRQNKAKCYGAAITRSRSQQGSGRDPLGFALIEPDPTGLLYRNTLTVGDVDTLTNIGFHRVLMRLGVLFFIELLGFPFSVGVVVARNPYASDRTVLVCPLAFFDRHDRPSLPDRDGSGGATEATSFCRAEIHDTG